MKHHVLLSDDIHIHPKNFRSLFDYFSRAKVSIVTHNRHADLKKSYGHYDGDERLAKYVQRLGTLEDQELLLAEHSFHEQPLSLFSLCQAECLVLALARNDQIHAEAIRYASASEWDSSIRSWLIENERELVVHNMAAAQFWIDEWQNFLGEQGKLFSEAFVFGGSPIYMRTLMEICKWTKTRVFALESTFTGHEFYVEERYSPLGNSSDIRFPTVRKAIHVPSEPDLRFREIAKGLGKLLLSENKNVQQPPPSEFPKFSDPSKPTLLLIGQVTNDFSIIEQRTGWLSSVAFYRELVQKVLQETDCNIVFKGHPWEEKKVHLEAPRTVEALSELQNETDPGRFAICSHHNLVSLGKEVEHVALLNSQAGLELAFFCGLRPATFGNPFYSEAGFSDEYSSIDVFIKDLINNRPGHLDLNAFEALQDFLMRYLQFHTVTERPSGVAQVQAKLALRPEVLIPTIKKVPGRLAKPTTAITRATASSLGKPEQSYPPGSAMRKWRKLLRNPLAFLRDSKLAGLVRKK